MKPVTIVAGVLAIAFFPMASPDIVLFSNDASFGAMSADYAKKPAGYGEVWADLNYLGFSAPGPSPVSITGFLQTPVMPFACACIVLVFSLWYRPRYYYTYRRAAWAVSLAVASVCGGCAMLGLLGVLSFYDHPWMFFLAPGIVGWMATFSICHYGVVESY